MEILGRMSDEVRDEEEEEEEEKERRDIIGRHADGGGIS